MSKPKVRNIKYYTLAGMDKVEATYKLILSTRSDGKSYAVKHRGVERAIEDPDNHKLIYLRRWDVDLKSSIGNPERYFKDVKVVELTNGEYTKITVFRNEIYLTRTNDKGKDVRGTLIGYVMALNLDEHYKSGSYTDVGTIIYEEFITNNRYLPLEPRRLMGFVSTICRQDDLDVYMVGNTMSRMCPYFRDWNLHNIPKQKYGTIEIYKQHTNRFNPDGTEIIVNVAVELASPAGNFNKMSFGTTGTNITGGVWEVQDMPKIPGSRKDYSLQYEFIFHVMGFKFLCEFLMSADGSSFWYVSPKTTEIQKNTRVVSDMFDTQYLHTQGLLPLNKREQIAFNYMKSKKICYSDNMTGSDFEQAYKHLTNSR